MQPWIDPRERRARWYFSSLLLLSVVTLLAMIFLILRYELTLEERTIAFIVAALSAIGGSLAALKLKGLRGEFEQQNGLDE
ncbi:hypothetical protein [Arthrobacter sp. D3-16]